MKKKIAFISQPEYFRFIYEKSLNNDFEVREFPFHFGMKDEELKDLLDFDADYNIFFRGEFFPDLTLSQLKGVKIALSSEPFPRKIDKKWDYTLDSIKRYLTFRKIRGKSFDYVFHYDVSSLSLFSLDDLKISGEFIFPVALDTYKNIENDKKWDFFFIGRSTIHRENYFTYLKHIHNFFHIAHGVWGEELVDYMSKSKICLNVHAENEISWEPRMQMMLACGCFVISEKITPNSYLRPNVDYIEFNDGNDLYQKVEYFLNNEEERKKIIKNAQERIIEKFDSRKNFNELFEKIENGKIEKFKSNGKGNFLINCLAKIIKV